MRSRGRRPRTSPSCATSSATAGCARSRPAGPSAASILDWLAGRFEPGKTYPERDVNLLLGLAHADVAALRRYLVDEEFLERRDGFYWRAGGTFEMDDVRLADG